VSYATICLISKEMQTTHGKDTKREEIQTTHGKDTKRKKYKFVSLP
jgi:hypothetical protein